MTVNVKTASADTDAEVDTEILSCMNLEALQSFFLYAGAGSGKTRSLVNALQSFRDQYEDKMRQNRKSVAVITYTNAACDEITDRLERSPLFDVSTIHSFCWKLIRRFHKDIQIWLLDTIPKEIAELEEEERKGRPGTKASDERTRKIASRRERLEWLSTPRQFTYNPNGDNFGKESLNHAEVLKLTSFFLKERPIMQKLLVAQHPIVLIDESQDTNSALMEALLILEKRVNQGAHRFCLGLIGDMMQRIYGDGHPHLESAIPDGWFKPAKKMNHRSPQRVVELANSIRNGVDGYVQYAREDSEQGFVRFFVCPAEGGDPQENEVKIRSRMAEICGDEDWRTEASVKTLALEHRMSAARMGFEEMYAPLYGESTLQTGLLDGTLAGVRLFSVNAASLEAAIRDGDDYAIVSTLREAKSPALHKRLSKNGHPLEFAQSGVDAFTDLIQKNPSFMQVLICIHTWQLFEIPDSLAPFVGTTVAAIEEDGQADGRSGAWNSFLQAPYNQIHPYDKYTRGEGPFGTHQGVKGQEFDHVMVVMSDSEARGFLFSYEKLLGAKGLSAGEQKKRAEGEETSFERTARLFYVTCTRAKKSLALVAYTSDVDRLMNRITEIGWLEKDEVEVYP